MSSRGRLEARDALEVALLSHRKEDRIERRIDVAPTVLVTWMRERTPIAVEGPPRWRRSVALAGSEEGQRQPQGPRPAHRGNVRGRRGFLECNQGELDQAVLSESGHLADRTQGEHLDQCSVSAFDPFLPLASCCPDEDPSLEQPRLFDIRVA